MEDEVVEDYSRDGSPFLEISDAFDPLLSIADHLDEEVGEAGSAQLRSPASIEVSIIDCLPIRRVAEAWRRAPGSWERLV